MISRSSHRIAALVLAIMAAAALSGCSETRSATQPARGETSRVLAAGHTIGQTFVPKYSGLSAIAVSGIVNGPADRGELVLHLRTGPEAATDLASTRVPAALAAAGDPIVFRFPPVSDSRGRSLYFELSPIGLVGDASFAFNQAPGAAYQDGALYADGLPQDSQLSFSLYHDVAALWTDRFADSLAALALVACALALFFLPGAGLLVFLRPTLSATWMEWLALSCGLSLSLYPLVMLWTHAAGIHLGAGYVAACAGGGALLVAWRLLRTRRSTPVRAGFLANLRSLDLADAAALGVLVAVVISRLMPLRWLTAPSWGDSVQHAVITQLMVDQGGLFSSWLPYAPYGSLTIHFGFHAAAAALEWATGTTAAWSVLAAGQLVNIIAVIAVGALATRLAGGNRWAGAAAMLLAGLLSDMPAFYVNWGRYPQLIGLAILPPAAWLLMDAAGSGPSVGRRILLAAVATAGMTLAYYRLPFYLGALAVVWLIAARLPEWRLARRPWSGALAAWLVTMVAALVIMAPWAGNLLAGKLAAMAATPTASGVADPLAPMILLLDKLTDYVPNWFLALAALGMVVAVLTRSWASLAAPVAAVAWTLLPLLQPLPIPSVKFLDVFSVLIALYIPVAAAGGVLVGWTAGRLGRTRALRLFGAVSLCAAAAFGLWTQAGIVKPEYIMVTPPDLVAMDWIRRETPAAALFLVQSFPTYMDTSAVGSDAGWWIPLLAGRQNTMPPQYALMDETPLQPGYSARVSDLVVGLREKGTATPAGVRLLCAAGVTHVYQGQLRGAVSAAASPLFTSSELATSASFAPVYRRDRVEIYRLKPEACL